jgi:hypothetical protein
LHLSGGDPYHGESDRSWQSLSGALTISCIVWDCIGFIYGRADWTAGLRQCVGKLE